MKVHYLLICCLLASCQSSQEHPSLTPTIPVIAITPNVKDIPIYVEAVGTLCSSALLEVKPEVDGTIIEVHVLQGQSVEKGSLLFLIDSKPYAVKVAKAQAQLAMDQARLQAAKKKYERFQALARKDLISQNEWDELERDVAQAKSAVELDQASLDEAKIDLEHCKIVAKAAGRVGKLDVHPGQLISKGDKESLAQISATDPLMVEFYLTENEFGKLLAKSPHETTKTEIHKIEIQLLSQKERSYFGKITFSDNHFDARTGRILLRGVLANDKYLLRPGMNVRVRVPVGIHREAKTIPQKAIKFNQNGSYVYLVQADSTMALRQVAIGGEHGDDVIVLEGLEPDTLVITDGHEKASVGSKVEVKQ